MKYIIKGLDVLIDKQDAYLLEERSWWTNGKYLSGWSKEGTVYLHRLIMNPPRGKEVDHINGNRYDNRRSNLRLCTRSQNNANWKGKHRPGSSKYRGVCWRKDTKKWKAEVQLNGKTTNIGCFDSEVEAAKAYDSVAQRLFGEFAYQNFGSV